MINYTFTERKNAALYIKAWAQRNAKLANKRYIPAAERWIWAYLFKQMGFRVDWNDQSCRLRYDNHIINLGPL